MWFAVSHRFSCLDNIERYLRAGVMRTMFVIKVGRAVLSISFVVHRYLVSLDLKGRVRRAGVTCAVLAVVAVDV